MSKSRMKKQGERKAAPRIVTGRKGHVVVKQDLRDNSPTPLVKPSVRPELFLIPDETVRASDPDEVLATYNDMASLEIAHMPYSHCIIGVAGKSAFSLTLPKGTPLEKVYEAFESDLAIYHTFEARFHFFDEALFDITVRADTKSPWKSMREWRAGWQSKLQPHAWRTSTPEELEKLKHDAKATGYYLRQLLIVLLATRNVLKVRTKDKLLSLGIGKHKPGSNMKPLYTTTISLPPPEPSRPGEPTGRTIAPHLRRGHIRNQVWGPRRSFHKAVWIEPVFVNADPSYVSTRVAYNTSL